MIELRPALPVLLVVLAGCSFGAPAPTPAPTAHEPGVATAEAQPVDRSVTPADLIVTERIRRTFVEDSELARVEPRVVIATDNHVVTLTGTVATERQRGVMAAHARATEGVEHLDNQIALAP